MMKHNPAYRAAVRNDHLFARLAALRRSGVYRQTFGGNLGLFVAALAGKL
ncbi:MAG: hypothetical protein LBB65_01725 [Burkholderiales bacterium]|jgi:hypothetical protein|nr:hypothetical protein [Burkholderiales bacterium]